MRRSAEAREGHGQGAISSLQGVLLALLLGEERQALHGYKLATLAQRRLGSGWDVSRQSVYSALRSLAGAGLVRSVDLDSGERGRVVYLASESTESAYASWISSPVVIKPARTELAARIAASRPCDAGLLLDLLASREESCFDAIRRAEHEGVRDGSWPALRIRVSQAAADESMKAELSWIAVARQSIEEFMANASR
jgi:DNA-binding PadR family transcriptional regulator